MCPTWSSVSFLHPEVAVALGDTCLRVEERHPHAPLCAQTGIIVVTLLHSIPVILLTQPSDRARETINATAWIKTKINQRCFLKLTQSLEKPSSVGQKRKSVTATLKPAQPCSAYPPVSVCMQREVLQACSPVIVTLSLQPLSRCRSRPSPRQPLRAPEREHRLAKACEIRAQTGVDFTEDETKA